MPAKGAVATGHPLTSAAAEEILQDGGNAFDAILAAHFTACIAEPVLASLAGGGYLLAEPAGKAPRVYDFFAQTPLQRERAGLDFYPISADFGPVRQEFHVGLASAATPGAVKGMFAIHRDLATLPMRRLVEPALRAARGGVRLTAMQAYALDVVRPIYLASDPARAIFGSRDRPGEPLKQDEHLLQPTQADALEALALEGEALFYRGEIARSIAELCGDGGLLTRADLERYQVAVRPPLVTRYRGAELLANPPPSSGGILIAFALALLEPLPAAAWGSVQAVGQLAVAMAATNRARSEAQGAAGDHPGGLLEKALLQRYREQVSDHPLCSRGTTQLSVVDADGNLASMTVSNGEGCGELIPGTGIMLNNMLGEEDINPGGFFRWQPDTRMTSMMAPAILHHDGGRAVLGSGGSNRLRTAILQVILNLVDHRMALDEAVAAPRIHLENEVLNLEPGACRAGAAALMKGLGEPRQWPEKNLFFGGVHSVWSDGRGFQAAGDERRGGAGIVC